MDKIIISSNEYDVANLPIQESKHYGIGVFFNSSESRALVYRSVLQQHSLSYAILVDFNGGTNENKKINLVSNLTALEGIADERTVLDFADIFSYQQNLDKIVISIKNYLTNVNNKSVFIDISGVPLIYSVALLKFLFRLFPIPDISILNASGRYIQRGEEQFADGEQYDMYIPGFYGAPDHTLPQHYIFLLGYDGERSLNIYLDNLPERISVIVPSPGYDIGNDKNTINNNREFLREIGFDINEYSEIENNNGYSNLYYIDISDIESVKERIESIYDEDKDKYEIRLVPLGPKPHAIGAALAAVFNNNISIMYQVPRKYYMSEVPVGDKIWLYDFMVEE
ncbi:MAG: hypothetical protein MJZ72_09305 [Bacteroidales bacterium]|nr:hypothetical protein [Bacteroidales bacterium]